MVSNISPSYANAFLYLDAKEKIHDVLTFHFSGETITFYIDYLIQIIFKNYPQVVRCFTLINKGRQIRLRFYLRRKELCIISLWLFHFNATIE